jgi:hypothetical protein
MSFLDESLWKKDAGLRKGHPLNRWRPHYRFRQGEILASFVDSSAVAAEPYIGRLPARKASFYSLMAVVLRLNPHLYKARVPLHTGPTIV